MPPLRRLSSGQMPTADDWNALCEMAQRAFNLTTDPSTGIEVVRTGGGPLALRSSGVAAGSTILNPGAGVAVGSTANVTVTGPSGTAPGYYDGTIDQWSPFSGIPGLVPGSPCYVQGVNAETLLPQNYSGATFTGLVLGLPLFSVAQFSGGGPTGSFIGTETWLYTHLPFFTLLNLLPPSGSFVMQWAYTAGAPFPGFDTGGFFSPPTTGSHSVMTLSTPGYYEIEAEVTVGPAGLGVTVGESEISFGLNLTAIATVGGASIIPATGAYLYGWAYLQGPMATTGGVASNPASASVKVIANVPTGGATSKVTFQYVTRGTTSPPGLALFTVTAARFAAKLLTSPPVTPTTTTTTSTTTTSTTTTAGPTTSTSSTTTSTSTTT